MQKRTLIISAVGLIVAMVLPACERKGQNSTAPAGRSGSKQYKADYIVALGAANRFCRAWLDEDFVMGKSMLTRELVRKHPERLIADALAGPGNPRHAAFEIFAGRKLGPARFQFQLRLFLLYRGGTGNRTEAVDAQIVMVRSDDGQWRVDEFPILAAPASLDPSGG